MSSFARTMRVAIVILGCAALFLFRCNGTLLAQNLTSAASLSGIVSDPQGARIAGATVTISNTGQSFTRSFSTDASGAFSFTLLPAAEYSLKVEAAGFRGYHQDKIVLEVGEAGT
jgi:hypothetical protein